LQKPAGLYSTVHSFMKLKPSLYPAILLLAVLAIQLLPGCAPSPERSRLEQIETIIDEHPDSAMTLIDSIDTAALRSDRDLLTEALDKTHRNPANDTLITTAIDYFADKGDRRREMIATYYGARVQYLNNDFSHAIVRFFRAKEIAEELGEHFWHGMAARGISDIFSDSYNHGDALRYAKEELEFTLKSKRQPYINYAFLDMAKSHYNYGDHNKAIEIAHNLIDSAAVYNDFFLNKEANQIIGTHFLTNSEPDKAYPIFLDICQSGYADPIDSTFLFLSISAMGNSDKAIDLNDKLLNKDKIATSSIKYNYLKRRKRTDDALQELENLYSLNVKEYKEKIRNNFTNIAVDYYQNKQLQTAQELKSKKLLVALVILSALLVIFIITVVTRLAYTKKNKEIERKVLLAIQLQEHIYDLERDRDSLNESLENSYLENNMTNEKLKRTHEELELTNRKLVNYNEKLNQNRAVIKSLLSSKFEMLENLCRVVVESNDEKTANKKIAKKVSSLIEDMSIDDNNIKNIERKVDEIHDNLMSDLRRELPSLKEEDIRLYLYSVLGFSLPVITLFLKKDSISQIYSRKKRLKAKINTLNPDKSARFLLYIN